MAAPFANNGSGSAGTADIGSSVSADRPSSNDYTAMFSLPTAGGFDPEVFVSTPVDDSYMCSVCKMVLRNPMLVVACGHHFCQSCIGQSMKVKEQCPLDRGPLFSSDAGALVPNLDMKRRVGQLEVYCESKAHGCLWQGCLCSYDVHINTKQCKLSCPAGCGEVLTRADLGQHEEVCGYMSVHCPYQFVGDGCDYECQRKDQSEHIASNMLQHSLMLVKSVDQLTARLWQVAGVQEEDRRTVHTFGFDNFAHRLRHGRPFYSDAFYIGPCESGYRLRMKIDPDDSQVGISFYYALVKGKNDERLEWPFRRTVIVQCLHSTEDRVIVEQTVRPPSEEEKSRKYTSRPGEVNNRRGWGRKGILSREKQTEAGAFATDRLRVRYIVPWEHVPGPVPMHQH